MTVTVLSRRLITTFMVLVCFSTWIPLSFEIAGLNLRASQLMLPILLGWLVIKRRKISSKPSAVLICGIFFWLANLAWTLIDVESSAVTGRVFLLALNMLHAVAIYGLVINSGKLMDAILSLIWAVTVFNVFQIAATAAGAFNITLLPGLIEQEQAPILSGGALTGGEVMRFAFGGVNTGVISACVILLCLALLFTLSNKPKRRLILYALISAMGMVMSFSRQAVVSLAVGIAIFLIYLISRAELKALLRTVGTLVLVCASFWLVSYLPGGGQMFSAFAGRAYQLLDERSYYSGTVSERNKIWSAMLSDIEAHPLVGLGQDSYIRYTKIGTAGSHNYPLEVWHATGLFGFLAYFTMHALLLFRAARQIFSRHDFVTLGILAAFLGVIASSFTNLIATNPFYWIVLGLLAASLNKKQSAKAAHSSDLIRNYPVASPQASRGMREIGRPAPALSRPKTSIV